MTDSNIDFTIGETDLYAHLDNGVDFTEHGRKIEGRKLLYRQDTLEPISIVSNRYRVVQPKQVVDVMSEAIEDMGWLVVGTGVAPNNKRLWIQADTRMGYDIGGDEHHLYVLGVTSFDGSTATLFRGNHLRLVCHNALLSAVRSRRGNTYDYRGHGSEWSPKVALQKLTSLNLAQEAADMQQALDNLTQLKLSDIGAITLFDALLQRNPVTVLKTHDRLVIQDDGLWSEKPPSVRETPSAEALWQSYMFAPGATPGTAYGALNAVTHYADHVKGRDASREAASLIGGGADLKRRALNLLTF
jgi:phage/plasmid-like protein (TIGR03299 family)